MLHDQYNNISSNATNSQNLETTYDAYDDFTADDFVVPTGQTWSIAQVAFEGGLFQGSQSPSSFNVFFYTNGGSKWTPCRPAGTSCPSAE